MKRTLSKSPLASTIALFGAIGMLAFSIPAQAAPDRNPGDRIEGVWDSQVNIVDCQSGTVLAGFRGLGLFIRGGALTQTNNMPPFLSSPSLGHWQALGAGHYTATFRFFRFLADGTNTGMQKVTRDFQVDPSGSTFSGTVVFETYDTSGNLIATGCGTETSTRVVD